MYYQNLELEFPIFDEVGIRGVVFTDAGNAWNLEGIYCQAGGAPRRSTWSAPVSTLPTLARLAYLLGLRHPLVLAARPAALRVGLPVRAAAVRGNQRLRVHHRQLLLKRTRPSDCRSEAGARCLDSIESGPRAARFRRRVRPRDPPNGAPESVRQGQKHVARRASRRGNAETLPG